MAQLESGNSNPRVSEDSHPRPIVTPVIRMPGILRCPGDPFRVRHHDCDSAVFVAETTNPVHRAIWIGRILSATRP